MRASAPRNRNQETHDDGGAAALGRERPARRRRKSSSGDDGSGNGPHRRSRDEPAAHGLEETYAEAYQRLGSHALARKALGAQAALLAERRAQTADGFRRRDWERLKQRQYERRVATDGPFRVQHVVEKMQADPNGLRRHHSLESISFDDLEKRKSGDSSAIIRAAMRAALSSRVISLQWKGLDEVPDELQSTLTVQLNHVQTILLMGNRFRELPTWSRYSFRNLRELNVSNNLLETLPGNLGDFAALETIVCKQNALSTLPSSLCKLSRLRVLDARGNRLACLPKGIGKLKRLETLLLGENHIELLPWSFRELASLSTLEIGRNVLQALAFIEILQIRDDDFDAEDFDKIWQKRVLPTNAVVYYNTLTKEVLQRPPKPIERGDPWAEWVPGDPETAGELAASRVANPVQGPETGDEDREEREENDGTQVPALQLHNLGGHAGQKKRGLSGAAQQIVLRRKAVLARQGKGIWGCELDLESGHQVYMNNLFRVSQLSMPGDLDRFGRLKMLTRLVLRRNKLNELPVSFGELTRLTYVDVSTNKLSEIAPCVFNLKDLEHLDMSDNAICAIPREIHRLLNLRVLLLQRNAIGVVPDTLGQLLQLEKLWLMDNALGPGSMPSSLRALKALEDIQLGDNAVLDDQRPASSASEDPIATVALQSLSQGRVHRREVLPRPVSQAGVKLVGGFPVKARAEKFPALMWHFEEQNRLELLGPPPKTHKVTFGIAQELQDFSFRFNKEEREQILAARTSGVLYMHWRGLCEIPKLVFRVSSCLVELRLVGNELPALEEEIGALENLRVLDVRSNKITTITSRIGGLKELQELVLADNALEMLPDPIGELGSLVKLAIQGNKISALPETIGGLCSLRELEANVNHLEALPASFARLSSLQALLLNNNHFRVFPAEILALSTLRVLHLNLNGISAIPDEISQLGSLKTLHLASNRIGAFQNALAAGPLTQSLESLWLTANEIPELCDDFHRFCGLKDLRLDLNQMVSPPEDFALREGVASVLRYCKIRASRLEKIVTQLREADFIVEPSNLRPHAKGVLVGNTGFLTTEMLAEVDDQLERYLNGPIFDHPGLSGRKIVQDAHDLRAHQRHLFLDTVLRQYLIVMELLEADPSICSRYYFNPDVKRRWGRKKALIDCYAMRLDALFEDQEFPEQRAVISKLEERLPTDDGGHVRFREITFQGESFTLRRPVLEDALNSFEDPYHGQATTSAAPVKFKPYRDYSQEPSSVMRTMSSHRESGGGKSRDETTGDGIKDDPRTVKRPWMAAVIPKLIYTTEEAERSHYERSLIARELEATRESVEIWFASEDYQNRIKKELKRRKQNLKRRIAVTEVDVSYAEQAITEVKRELIDVKGRKSRFEKDAPVHEHGFNDQEEADAALAAAQEAVEQARKKHRDMKKLIKTLKAQVKEKPRQQEQRCRDDIRRKALLRRRRYIVFQGRMLARKRGLRRPWDGKNGQLFVEWMHYLDAIERDTADIEEETATNNKRYQLDPEAAAVQAELLRTAMEGVEARKELVFQIQELHDHPYGWSSDDSDGASDNNDFDMPEVLSDSAKGEAAHDGESSKSASRKALSFIASLSTATAEPGADDALIIDDGEDSPPETPTTGSKQEIEVTRRASQQAAQVAMTPQRKAWLRQSTLLRGEDDGVLELSSMSEEDSVGDSLSSMSNEDDGSEDDAEDDESEGEEEDDATHVTRKLLQLADESDS